MSRPANGPCRIGNGLLDPASSIDFAFNGQHLRGFAGDTLASALLANGRRLVGRSFKYHRPRGIFSAGVEEPNALVTLAEGARREPNTRATVIELHEGLKAYSQNHRGPLHFDLLAINDRLSGFLGAGFYYKTFMWPKAFWERVYEPMIRSTAGLGALSGEADPDEYDRGFLHTELLIVGTGPAGLSAALTAARSGLRVVVAEEDFIAGGRLNSETMVVDGQAGSTWAATARAELQSMSNVRWLSRTSVYGVFDHGIHGALQRCTDHLPRDAADGRPRHILWRVQARQTLLATGAMERSIAFADNDRPGIMLAGAVRSYLNRFGVASGRQLAIFTCNDDGWRTAVDLTSAGVNIAAVIDSRVIDAPFAVPGARLFTGSRVVATHGRLGLRAITLHDGKRIACDCLAVSGGWNPNLQLACHQRARPRWQPSIAAFVAADGQLPRGMLVAGAADGTFGLSSVLHDGHRKALLALSRADCKPAACSVPNADEESTRVSAFWQVSDHRDRNRRRAWVDLQNDVTTRDIEQSLREGFRSVEHLKRYTTLGMATDQGKTSNVLGLAVMAEMGGKSIEQTGTTIFRPPVSPIAIGALAGRARGRRFRPTRRTPSHAWASTRGATFVESGTWLRVQWFAHPGESHWRQSVDREVKQVRSSVGVCDVTTLGKIDIQGRDAAEFLDRVYVNTFSTLPVGKVRYGLMLREDGFVMDDGTSARLGEYHYLMTTTTANAVSVFRHLEFCRQCLWPKLDVQLMAVTEQWAQYAIAGPRSRELLERLLDVPFDVSNEAFPFMACAEVSIFNGTPARLFRISFSGELAYELAVPARHGQSLMTALMRTGESLDVVAYGTEALGVLRVEKGHPAGNEINGQTTAANLGLAHMISPKKDCIGAVLARRPALLSDDQVRLVGFLPQDRSRTLRAGAHCLPVDAAETLANAEGWMSSVAWSPSLHCSIGLGFIRRGDSRTGETVVACDPVRNERIVVQIVSLPFIDPQGERLRV